MNRFFICTALVFVIGALAGAAHAQTPAGTADAGDQGSPHKIILKFVSPDAVLHRFGWKQDKATGNTRNPLPDGVQSISAAAGDNSLVVYATAEGFALVKDIVQTLDVKPIKATLSVAFVMADQKDLYESSISDALWPHTVPPPTVPSQATSQLHDVEWYPVSTQVFRAFLKSHPGTVMTPFFTAVNEDSTAINVREILHRSNPTTMMIPSNVLLHIYVRVNGDATITFTVSGTLTGSAEGAFVHATRTVPGGETAAMPCDRIGIQGQRVLIMFVTPTILSDGVSQGEVVP